MVIGITGGAGCGKSYVAKIAAEGFDMLHVDTDNIARRQMEPGGISFAEVVDYFGESILKEDGSIDRTALAAIVFEDKDKLLKLNAITHPHVTETVKALIEAAADDFAHVLIETAILKEAGYEAICDEIWYVRAPIEDRRARLQERGYSPERTDSVLASQSTDEEFMAYATAVIDNRNACGEEEITRQIEEILKVSATRNGGHNG